MSGSSSNINNINNKPGQLISPSTYRPWSVEIASAVPVSIARMNESTDEPRRKKTRMTTLLDASRITAGAVCPGWACLGSSKGYVYVWSTSPINSTTATTTISSSGSGSNNTNNALLSPGKHPHHQARAVIGAPKSSVTLFHPELAAPASSNNNNNNNGDEDNNSKPMLMALTPASADAVFVYALQPASTSVFVWKVTLDHVLKASTLSLTNMIGYATTTLPLQLQDDDDDDDDDDSADGRHPSGEDEYVTSLTVLDRHMIVMGTSRGGLICGTQTTIPVSLQAQRMSPTLPSANSRFSLMNFFSSLQQERDSNSNDGSANKFCVRLDPEDWEEGMNGNDEEETTELLAFSYLGTIVKWSITPTVAGSHRVLSEAKYVTSLPELMQEHLGLDENHDTEPLAVERMGNRLHVIVRTTPKGTVMGGGDARMYWVRLHVESSHPRDETHQIHWVDCQWLNRFPAPHDVSVMGLVLSKNDLAYAAFHQGSGGVTSSVIVMALSESPDASDTSENATAIYEVDLPVNEVPALLPNTFTNDVVTHGCCVLARSGLGIRVRALPPASPATLSPRAAKRANPSAVLKLINHMRSSFQLAYQNQDGSTGTALPPSLLEASPVDLEEAIIALATQLHVQQSSDGAGWSIVSSALSSSGLEWHLAFINWLRQGGLYRFLTSYGKWRLLSLGQEVAAYQELISPTLASMTSDWEHDQFENLTLSNGGVAAWLKATLEVVLQTVNVEHYQLWCGWFSSALATAMTFREEQSLTPYDITSGSHPPPAVGSMNREENAARVPVWTSDSILQEIFGILFQYWNRNPKQYHILPSKTVEVCIRAGLIAFEDAAKSVPSEETDGRYSAIKKMSIPLLRTLHPMEQLAPPRPNKMTDDNLAFELAVRHEYYEGLCEIAHDHECKPDTNQFRLEPLLQSTSHCQSTDYDTDYNFGEFVMRWFANRELYGHTIVYGRLCPDSDLQQVLKSDERLHSHRWIQDVHKFDFNGATSSLMATAENTASVTLDEINWNLSMAKLANRVVKLEGSTNRQQMQSVNEREKKIESNLELVGLQKELLKGEPDSQQNSHFWSASRLLDLALQKVDQASSDGISSKKDVVRLCVIGLIVSGTFQDPVERRDCAVQFWTKSIQADWVSEWAAWVRNEDDLSSSTLARTVLDSTVFGGLLRECDDAALHAVKFSSEMMLEITENLGMARGGGRESLRRLLSSVLTSNEDENNDDEMVNQIEGGTNTTVMVQS